MILNNIDIYENIMNNNDSEEKLIGIINKNASYEKFFFLISTTFIYKFSMDESKIK